MTRPKGAWIFLSHSNEDWDQVRIVRNLLEEKGHRPIMFFLKCLSDESELDPLIRREIEAREWFLLCKSVNADDSRYVKKERKHIEKFPEKKSWVIDLHWPHELVVETINQLSKRVTVFLSYSPFDHSVVERIRDGLIARDYSVWDPQTALKPGSLWQQQSTEAIDDAVARGFVLLLLSTNAARSSYVVSEIEYALERASKAAHDANVLPIMLEDPRGVLSALPRGPQSLLAQIPWMDFSKGDFDTNMARLIASTKSRPMY